MQRRHMSTGDTDDKWFEEDEPPPSAPKTGDDENDPLDAFMAGISQQVTQQAAEGPKPTPTVKPCEEQEDAVDLYYKYKETHKSYGTMYGNTDEDVYAAAKAADQDAGYDSDGRPKRKKDVGALPPVDHSKAGYKEFPKCFYEGPAGESESEARRAQVKALDIHVTGYQPVPPVAEWQQLGLDSPLEQGILKQGFARPTPVQCAAIPIIMSGRDMLGLSKTGSGKTAAYVIPMCVHISMQNEPAKGQGPLGVVVAPTRELAQQIYDEARKLLKVYNFKVLPIFGGKDKGDQVRVLKAGSDAVVCTPGRMVDMLKQKACRMALCTFLVLDEADKLFDMGFEAQLRSIVGQIRPDRQLVMFSATFPPKLQGLAREHMRDPLTVAVGRVGVANADIRQEAVVVRSNADKWGRLLQVLCML